MGTLKEQEAGAKTVDVCRKHGISSATFYKVQGDVWRDGGADARRLKTSRTRTPASRGRWPRSCSTTLHRPADIAALELLKAIGFQGETAAFGGKPTAERAILAKMADRERFELQQNALFN